MKRIFKTCQRRVRNGLGLAGLVLAVSCTALDAGDVASGGMPNLEVPTFGGLQLWADVAWSDGWRVQRHVWSRHFRLLDPEDVRRGWGTRDYCESLLPPSEADHLVIVLHGLGRTRHSMRKLEDALTEDGYSVAALSYPSMRASLENHAEGVEQVLDHYPELQRVSFVTHSLGGRVARRVLEREGQWRGSVEQVRVVQLAPPNRGSSLAASLENVPFVGWVMGPAFYEVAEPDACADSSGADFAVLSGVRGNALGWNPLLLGDDDGVVSLHETRPTFEHAHRRIASLHTNLMNQPETIEATRSFLATGKLDSR